MARPRVASQRRSVDPRLQVAFVVVVILASTAFPAWGVWQGAEREGRQAELLTVVAAVALVGGIVVVAWWRRRARHRGMVQHLVSHGLLEAEVKCASCGSGNPCEGPARCTTCGRALPPIPGAPEG